MAAEEAITILEVGPRDGFQNLAEWIPTETKAQIVHRLIDAGVRYVEFSSFVHPQWIPQLADAADLYRRIKDREGVRFRALVPNERGLERALESGVPEVTLVVGATDRGNLANLNMTTAQSLDLVGRMGARAREAGARLCGSIAYALGDPLEGEVPVARILEIVASFRRAGAAEVSIADSIGMASPQKIRRTFRDLRREFPDVRWSIHLHNILGLGMANTLAAWESGVTVFESSIAGLGGCPYAPYPGGNVATEELAYLFERLERKTGLQMDQIMAARDFVRSVVGEKPPKQVGRPGERDS